MRHFYHWLLSLDIVYHPPLGRIGVWLCDRYEDRRYRTRAEDNLATYGLNGASGAFPPGGYFNIDCRYENLPPRRVRKPWFSSSPERVDLLDQVAKLENNRKQEQERERKREREQK